MSVQWVKGSPSEFVNTPFKAVKMVTDGFDMEALVEDAAALMKDLIASRGTNRAWSDSWPSRAGGRRWGSGPGRIDSGDMFDNVKSKVTYSSNTITGEFGWLDTQEMYYLFQEDGFTHFISGEHIPGMLALQDAGIQAQQEFIRRLSLAVKRG